MLMEFKELQLGEASAARYFQLKDWHPKGLRTLQLKQENRQLNLKMGKTYTRTVLGRGLQGICVSPWPQTRLHSACVPRTE